MIGVEQILGAAGALAEGVEDVASTDRTAAPRGSKLLPLIPHGFPALNSFGSDSASRHLGAAIRKQRLARFLQGLSLRHISASHSNNARRISDRRTGAVATAGIACRVKSPAACPCRAGKCVLKIVEKQKANFQG